MRGMSPAASSSRKVTRHRPRKIASRPDVTRAATAVFRVERGNWATDGRALFNLTPTEAVSYYQENLELVAQELAHHHG